MVISSILGVLACIFLSWDTISTIADAGCVMGAIFVVARYGTPMVQAFYRKQPCRDDIILCGMALHALGTGGLRLVRQVGLELEMLDTWTIRYSFVGISIVTMLGLFLKGVAPPLGDQKVQVTPLGAVGIMLVMSTGLALSITLLREIY
jgi:hypothetical protein